MSANGSQTLNFQTYDDVSKSCMIFPCESADEETPLVIAVAQIWGSRAPKFMINRGISLAWLGLVSGVQAEPGSALLTVILRKLLSRAAAADTLVASSRAK